MTMLVVSIENERIIGTPNIIHRNVSKLLPFSQAISGLLTQSIGRGAIQQPFPEVKKPLRIHTNQ